MDERDVAVLSVPGLGVTDLYVELALTHARDAERTLVDMPEIVSLAQGAACLSDAVGHLRDAAQRFLSPNGERQEQLDTLADALLLEAAAFEQAADVLASADRDGAG